MNRMTLALLGSLIVMGLLLYSLASESPSRKLRQPATGTEANDSASQPNSDAAILMYCAASNRAVVEKIRADYEDETGRRVEIQYGPSQSLLSSLEVSRTGDLYLPADESYLDIGRERGLVEEAIPLAEMQVVIAVRKGEESRIRTFDDLLSEDIRLVQANPDAAAVGKQTKEVLEKTGQWNQLDAATVGYRTTVTDVANDLIVGAADAGIVYDAVLATYPDLTAVKLPVFDSAIAKIAVGVTSASNDSSRALHFARYLGARDRGQRYYDELGFKPVNGDQWADVPELSVFAGSMLQPAIEQTLIDFEKREGVSISRVYNGCGILVAQMKAGQHPDAYFACDTEFMNQVSDQFGAPLPVSRNELVILVEKGNPHGIKSLRDLTRPSLRVGIGHEKQCAMGWLTQQTLTESGIKIEVMENVTVQTPTGDMLVNQLKTGSLDAAVAYLSNAAGSGDVLTAIRITGLECSQATQPIAISQSTPYSHLAGRLLKEIQSTDSRERFRANGFVWQAE
ncbi:putative binding protein precursor [Thalassoglobus neptunius]|uniref:Putative binding protein n=1 Tax=Thalassoglobus neptunius TaxID=1938619 RepID=A0A5C5WML6_9PLAN|nr:molybdate ABC transporter substrate-binding protein [Thalassoglobus neptunius]TWT51860.1 putative binding protein precursor [Thalassoglobus neptunius]